MMPHRSLSYSVSSFGGSTFLFLSYFSVDRSQNDKRYAVPTKAETQGSTDAAVNKFLQGRKREDVVLATKVAGRAAHINWLPREEEGTSARLNKKQILFSVDESLKRLGTDYIDLLQLHWPGELRRVSGVGTLWSVVVLSVFLLA